MVDASCITLVVVGGGAEAIVVLLTSRWGRSTLFLFPSPAYNAKEKTQMIENFNSAIN